MDSWMRLVHICIYTYVATRSIPLMCGNCLENVLKHDSKYDGFRDVTKYLVSHI